MTAASSPEELSKEPDRLLLRPGTCKFLQICCCFFFHAEFGEKLDPFGGVGIKISSLQFSKFTFYAKNIDFLDDALCRIELRFLMV